MTGDDDIVRIAAPARVAKPAPVKAKKKKNKNKNKKKGEWASSGEGDDAHGSTVNYFLVVGVVLMIGAGIALVLWQM